eukprot:COSAG05_NODE_13900_length_414_cov_55.136508_2_plen_64_part_01
MCCLLSISCDFCNRWTLVFTSNPYTLTEVRFLELGDVLERHRKGEACPVQLVLVLRILAHTLRI